jgi:hypothetical protein
MKLVGNGILDEVLDTALTEAAQNKQVFKTQQSRCFYCNSLSRGKGCRYGPHGVHVHLNDTKKCCYCGSTSYGNGCQINPFSKLHIHGLEFNTMLKEGLNCTVYNTVLLRELQRPITDFQCFKIGLVDHEGNVIRQPITEEERSALSPSIRTVLRIRRFLGPKVDLLNVQQPLEENELVFDAERFQKKCLYEAKFQQTLNDMHEIVDAAYNDGLTFEEISNIIQQ